MKKPLLFLAIAFGFMACTSNNGGVNEREKQIQDSLKTALHQKAVQTFPALPAVAENPNNEATEAKVYLGKVLYFDNRLSKEETQSCNSCHNLATYGVDNGNVSKGDNGGFGNRNSPTTIHSALQFVQFWDGRSPDVEDQAGGPVLNPVEMGIPDEKFLMDRLSKVSGYDSLFKAAFPDEDDYLTYGNIKKAIGAFERTLMPKSKFDTYLEGDLEALDSNEIAGLETFLNAGCTTCHNGTALGGSMYQKFGLFGNYWEHTNSPVIDSGRYVVTKNEGDLFVFKTPILRNIAMTYPYFHDGSVKDLSEAVKIMGKTELNKDLSDTEIQAIVTFLNTLTSPVSEEVATAPAML